MKWVRHLKRLSAVIYLVFISVWIYGILKSFEGSLDIKFKTRYINLLLKSNLLAVLSSSITVIIAILASWWIYNSKYKNSNIRWMFIGLVPIPYYVYCLSWMHIIGTHKISGIIACIFVNVLAFLPLGMCIILSALESSNRELEEQAMIFGGSTKMLYKIVLPSIAPIILGTAGILYVISLTDFSVASLFQYSTFTLELFSEYSRGRNLFEVGLLSLLEVVPALIILYVSYNLLGSIHINYEKGNRESGWKIDNELKIFCLIAIEILLIQFIIPLISFLINANGIKGTTGIINNNSKEFIESLKISMISGLIIGITTYLGSDVISKNRWLVVIGLLPLAFPSSIIGMGVLKAINGSIIHDVSKTSWIMIIGSICKYEAFGFILISNINKRIDTERLELAEMFTGDNIKDGLKYLVNVKFKSQWKLLLTVVFIISALVFGDESLGLILMPPGHQTIAVKVYTYLHYGASELVSGFCFVTTIVTEIILIILIGLSGKHDRDN